MNDTGCSNTPNIKMNKLQYIIYRENGVNIPKVNIPDYNIYEGKMYDSNYFLLLISWVDD